VSTGGGGLLAGISVAIKSLRPDVRIVGAQAAGAAAYPPSLAAHHPVTLDQVVTMADGIAVPRPGDLPFAIVESLVDEVVTVSEDSLSRALLMLLERAKLVVEPAGAAAVGALMDAPEHFHAPVVAVLSGGNVDPLLLMRVLRQGMDAAGRYLALRLSIRDTPGSLAHLLSLIGSLDANVVEVEHRRTGPHLGLQDVEVDLELETRGPSHATEVLTCLQEAGYRASRRTQ
jgi:threonine dehydratase